MDTEALEAGTLVLEFSWPVDGQDVSLRAVYPDSFPRMRPIVFLRTIPADFPDRHCSPTDGVLCLLGRDSRQWRSRWTLRTLLEKQLADTLNGTGPEDQQGEPTEYWWNTFGLDDSYCLIDSDWALANAKHGTLKLRFHSQWIDGKPVIKAAVVEILDDADNRIAAWDGALPPELLPESCKTFSIPWMRIEGPLAPTGDAAQINELADSNLLSLGQKSIQLNLTHYAQCFGVAYDSELAHEKQGIAWLFPILYGTKKRLQRKDKGKPPEISIIRTLRAGKADIGARVPGVECLRDKSVAVFGLGALGAPLAIEIARNGCCRLYLVDHDLIEPGNSIRWPLGATAWGQDKAAALSAFIQREYPWTEAVSHRHNIGTFSDKENVHGDETLFTSVLEGADLVIDATASYGVTTILGDHCRERGLPLIALFASPTVEGGIVARYEPDDGCPTCLEYAWSRKQITKPPGLGAENGLQQPPGCAELTFTGASYDLQELSLQAMRLVIDTFDSQGEERKSNVYTLNLTDAGERIPPCWDVDPLPKDPDCSCGQ